MNRSDSCPEYKSCSGKTDISGGNIYTALPCVQHATTNPANLCHKKNNGSESKGKFLADDGPTCEDGRSGLTQPAICKKSTTTATNQRTSIEHSSSSVFCRSRCKNTALLDCRYTQRSPLKTIGSPKASKCEWVPARTHSGLTSSQTRLIRGLETLTFKTVNKTSSTKAPQLSKGHPEVQKNTKTFNGRTRYQGTTSMEAQQNDETFITDCTAIRTSAEFNEVTFLGRCQTVHNRLEMHSHRIEDPNATSEHETHKSAIPSVFATKGVKESLEQTMSASNSCSLETTSSSPKERNCHNNCAFIHPNAHEISLQLKDTKKKKVKSDKKSVVLDVVHRLPTTGIAEENLNRIDSRLDTLSTDSTWKELKTGVTCDKDKLDNSSVLVSKHCSREEKICRKFCSHLTPVPQIPTTCSSKGNGISPKAVLQSSATCGIRFRRSSDEDAFYSCSEE
eukprot:Filipodium_phascolosomae@DN2604_c0_g1_i14.p1